MNFVNTAQTRIGTSGHVDVGFHRAPCVLVHYDESLASMAALRAACANAKPGTRIVAVYLDVAPLKPEPTTRADHHFIGKAVLAAASVNAATYGHKIETLCLETNSRGVALARLAAECGNSTIYMGVDSKQPDWLTDYMRTHAPGQVVLVQA